VGATAGMGLRVANSACSGKAASRRPGAEVGAPFYFGLLSTFLNIQFRCIDLSFIFAALLVI
jgi:hypothetical protein